MKFFLISLVFCLACIVVAQDADCPTGEVVIGKKCGKCPPGKFYDSYDKTCTACSPGTFKAADGQGDCIDCSSGTFSLEGASECIACSDGQALLKNGKCGTCTPGRYYDKYDVRCVKCSMNYFQPSAGIRDSCFECAGNAQSLKGASECTKCPANQALMRDGKCASCQPGRYYSRYSLKCIKCERNTFTSEENVKSGCFSCSGNTNANVGATMCTECPANQALMKDGNCGSCPPGSYFQRRRSKCKKCRPNTFQPNENVATKCIRCSGDTHSSEGAISCTKCPSNQALMKNGKCGTCSRGKYYDSYNNRCVKCSRNTFQPDENVMSSCISCSGDTNALRGATMCTKCEENEVLMRNGTCSSCPKGTGYDRYSLKCRKCGFNEYSKGTGIHQQCESCPSFEYSNKGASECFKCPGGQALIAKTERRGVCGVCDPGHYYESYSAKCERCYRGEVSIGGNIDSCTACEEGKRPNRDRSECI